MTVAAYDLLGDLQPEEADVAQRRREGKVTAEVVASVVFRHDKVLLIRRDIPGVRTSWLFPAGKIETGEGVFDAATREVLEETGVFCRPLKIVSKRRHPITGKAVVYVACEFMAPAKKPLKEYKTRWFSSRNLSKMLGNQVSPAVMNTINVIKEGRGLTSFGPRRSGRQETLFADPDKLC